ncbi:HAD family hydrolase [Pseudaquabacterium pictum]|uniref:Hydrolase phosphatase n=1 Tax=Pseudaquabacterium pictum TaxID=2315236 RepID=A0A480AWD8_9BURK|nr:HAD family hydrolase [Rubrivivax pictus]GCL63108.1 hydrolase phosphatase [Rubrivivax pictus]
MVIFDCDGVLVDSERLTHQVVVDMLAEHGVALPFEEAVDRFIGMSMANGLVQLKALLGGELPADFLPEMGRRTRAAFRAGLTSVPGVEAVLDGLHRPYCVASNGNHAKVNFTLGHTGLLPRFAGRIFTADDVQHPKPAPDLFLLAARSLGAAPERTTVVEDTPTGVTAAKAAGMRAIGFAAMTPAGRLQAAGADAIAHDMASVARLLAAERTA